MRISIFLAVVVLLLVSFPANMIAYNGGRHHETGELEDASSARTDISPPIYSGEEGQREVKRGHRPLQVKVAGSRLPDCMHACGSCSPCRLVTVSFACASLTGAETCPISYKCTCNRAQAAKTYGQLPYIPNWKEINKLHRKTMQYRSSVQLARRVISTNPCDVFINHRGIDTKRTLATLLYDYLSQLNIRPFLDNKNMKPGDKLFEKIDTAIHGCKIGVALFSPNYCKSYFCLHELALFMESKKKVIPIFCDIKPSQLRVPRNGVCSEKELRRFNWALEEAKHTVGLTFDSYKGNFADVVTSTSEIVIKSLIELESDEQRMKKKLEASEISPLFIKQQLHRSGILRTSSRK